MKSIDSARHIKEIAMFVAKESKHHISEMASSHAAPAKGCGNSAAAYQSHSGSPSFLQRCLGNSSLQSLDKTLSLSDELEAEQTASSASTSSNSFNITFDPTTTTPRPQAAGIQFIQSIQMTVDGAPIKPGTYYSGFAYRDPTAISDATYIDHLATFRTPYLAENGHGTEGFSNGGTRNATFADAPNTGGGDKGFKSASNPTGWGTVTYKFQTLAFCTAGTDCGTWYDGIQWNYTKTDADHAAGRAGVSTATGSLIRPSASTIGAFDQFNSVKGFTPCTVSVSPGP